MKIAEVDVHQIQPLARSLGSDSHPHLKKNQVDTELHPPTEDDTVELHANNSDYAIRKLEEVNTVLSKVAGSIRSTDDTMENIDQHLKKMKSDLVEIIKLFPPFPPGSEERVKNLKHFSTLRRQIDALAFEPPDEGAREIMGDSKQGAPVVTFGDKEIQIGIRRQPVHTGPGALNIPELPHTADNDQIHDTLDRLDNAIELLGQRRTELAEDVEKITLF
ncbi:MAG: hypothetical protein HKM93_07480 [Desulfobacteraceae bacterium]|nr:hypothetical protein [Desulfobacteraceae bacterium]